MPRKTADRRHADSAPDGQLAWPPDAVAVVDALIAALHPARRQLRELLLLEGPATVGQLAQRSGLAPGSVSHHLKPLHRCGFVEPAPELAADSRQSWWRAVRRSLSWSPDDFPAGSLGREIATMAEQANLTYHDAAARRWLAERDTMPRRWREAAVTTDNISLATPAQAADLGHRLSSVISEWSAECRRIAEEDPDREDTMPVRVIARVFPSELGRAE